MTTTGKALEALLRSQPGLWRGRDRHHHGGTIPTGFAALDAALPGHGWPRGGVTELMVTRPGVGEVSLLLPGLARVTGNGPDSGPDNGPDNGPDSGPGGGPDGGRWAALISPPFVPYAPALANAGLRLDRLLIVDGGSDENALWAAEQVLRAGLFAAVVVWAGRSGAARQRRLQLAAESGGAWATVYRPASASEDHSPVALRIVVTAREHCLSLQLTKVRGGRSTEVRIDPSAFDAPQGVEWPGVRA